MILNINIEVVIILLVITLIYTFLLMFFKWKLEKEKILIIDEYNFKIKELENTIFNMSIKEKELNFQCEILNKQIEEYLKNEKRMTDTFNSIASQITNNYSESFFKKVEFSIQQINEKQIRNTEDFNKLLDPLKKSIENFHQQNLKVEQERISANEVLKNSLKSLADAYKDLKNETQKMSLVLTSSSKTAGRWGEIQLKRLIEFAGLIRYCEFQEQVVIDSNDGIIKPDVIITLPDNISVIIDAKTPISSYIKYKESTLEEDKKKYQKEYYKCIKNHITSLGSKKYWNQFSNSPEMVIMFLPGEDFWHTALEEDNEIMEHAYNMNVIVNTPLTLIPLLRMIALIWSKFQISQTGEDLRQKSLILYELLYDLNENIISLERIFDNSLKIFNKIKSIKKENKYTLIEEFRSTYFPLLPSFKNNQ